MMAEALEMPKDSFDSCHERHFSELRCNNYFGSKDSPVEGQRWISAHKDFTDFSILAPDHSYPHPALALAGRDDQIDEEDLAPYFSDCFTVVIGQPMQKRSNYRWFAPLHCVPVPKSPELN